MADTLFLQDVLDTASSLETTFANVGDQPYQIASALLAKGARRFVALGSGSSLYAAKASIYLHNSLARPENGLALAAPTGDYALYPLPLSHRDALIGVSASGEIVDLLDLFRAAGGRHQLVGVTNVAASSLTHVVDHTLHAQAGPSLVPTSTKAFVASIGVLDLLWLGLLRAEGVDAADRLGEELLAIPAVVRRSLSYALPQAAAAVDRLEPCSRFLIFGAGPAFAVAQEAALVFKEVSGVPAEAVQAREMAHGMVSIADGSLGVIAINPPGPGQRAAREVLAQFASFGASTLEVTTGEEAEPGTLCLDVSCHDLLTPFAYSGPLFVLANELASRRGVDTDHPAWEAEYLRQVRRGGNGSLTA
ncbi:MAG: SIS domain-containing protein [Anaerolineae bacterium]|nr:SIS domain-containing protein [Anaerolineae bacterium]